MLRNIGYWNGPLFIPEEKLSTECLPPVEAADLVSYLVLETSFYTKDQFKNFTCIQPNGIWFYNKYFRSDVF